TLNAVDANGLTDMWIKGGISKHTLFENLQRGEIISPERTFEEEEQFIQEDMPTASVAPGQTQPSQTASKCGNSGNSGRQFFDDGSGLNISIKKSSSGGTQAGNRTTTVSQN